MNRLMVQGLRAAFLIGAFAFAFGSAVHAQGSAEANYKAKCVACHGVDGSANTPAGKSLGTRDFHLPAVQAESDADLGAVIANGKNKMPAYAKQLKASDIADLVAYTRALSKK